MNVNRLYQPSPSLETISILNSGSSCQTAGRHGCQCLVEWHDFATPKSAAAHDGAGDGVTNGVTLLLGILCVDLYVVLWCVPVACVRGLVVALRVGRR